MKGVYVCVHVCVCVCGCVCVWIRSRLQLTIELLRKVIIVRCIHAKYPADA